MYYVYIVYTYHPKCHRHGFVYEGHYDKGTIFTNIRDARAFSKKQKHATYIRKALVR